jgi:cytochrome oxidase Cu insertion factor (SCO1/SenC/PrrC family)
VERLAEEPFALLGVNSDPDRDELKKVIQQQGIIWRSWWDGGGVTGPIATKWQIDHWPTVFVLDPGGVIRYVEAGGTPNIEAIEDVVNTLLKQRAAKSRD